MGPGALTLAENPCTEIPWTEWPVTNCGAPFIVVTDKVSWWTTIMLATVLTWEEEMKAESDLDQVRNAICKEGLPSHLKHFCKLKLEEEDGVLYLFRWVKALHIQQLWI